MNHNGNRNDCTAKLNKLRALDFALQETVLYLDAYPENKQALRYYHQLMKEREQLRNIYRQSVIGNLKAQLDNTSIREADGTVRPLKRQ